MSDLNPQPIPPGRRSVDLSEAVEAIVAGVLRAVDAREGEGLAATTMSIPGRVIAGGIWERQMQVPEAQTGQV
ncbi:MAG: hypothetical protein ABR511_08420 [Acidimicrobiales bacterium]